MDKYRKIKVIGKGSFGYAVLVQSIIDRQSYVMKVKLPCIKMIFIRKYCNISYYRSLMFQKWTRSKEKMP